MHGLDDTGRAALRAEQVGVVLQSGNLIPFLTALENVELAMGFTGRTGRRNGRGRSWPRWVSTTAATTCRDSSPAARRSGCRSPWRWRTSPTLLLADEVVGQLDSATADLVVDVHLRSRALAVLFVTHDETLAARGERRLRLVDGSVVEQ